MSSIASEFQLAVRRFAGFRTPEWHYRSNMQHVISAFIKGRQDLTNSSASEVDFDLTIVAQAIDKQKRE